MNAYHEASKHSWESVRGGEGGLDWDNQPDPYRLYAGAPMVPLDRSPRPISRPIGEVLARVSASSRARTTIASRREPFDLDAIGGLLFHSVALSATKEIRRKGRVESRWHLRVNPSSGNLHPTETYLCLDGSSGLPAGLYHYRAKDHALERRREGDAIDAVLGATGRTRPPGLAAVAVLTSIVWREAWKYRLRAYRYSLLDAGHAAASLVLAASAFDLDAVAIGGFADREMTEILACGEGDEVTRSGGRRGGPSDGGAPPPDEVPLVVVPMGTPEAIASLHAPEAGRSGDRSRARLGPPLGVPNALSPEAWRYELIDEIHDATSLVRPPAPTPGASTEASPEASPSRDSRVLRLPEPSTLAEPFGRLVRRRRSSLAHDRAAEMSLPDAAAVLAAGVAAQRADFSFDLVRLYVYAHSVRGLPPGLYLPRPGESGAVDSPLVVVLREGDERERIGFLSLEQEIARDAVFAMLPQGHGPVQAGLLGRPRPPELPAMWRNLARPGRMRRSADHIASRT